MKNLIILFLLLISVVACKKEDDTIYKYYDSEIFSGEDLKIYGNWEYIYTIVLDSWAGGTTKIYNSYNPINIKPIGYWEREYLDYYSMQTKIYSGKIEIVGTKYKHLLVRLTPDEVTFRDQIEQRIIYVQNKDTLVIAPSSWEGGFFDYYKRKK